MRSNNCSAVLVHSRMTTHNGNILCISEKKPKKRILNVFMVRNVRYLRNMSILFGHYALPVCVYVCAFLLDNTYLMDICSFMLVKAQK